MASIYRRAKIWWITYYKDGQKVQLSLKTHDPKYARYKQGEIETALVEQRKPPHLRPFPIQKALQDYFAYCEFAKSPKTFRNDRSRLTAFLDSLLVGKLHEITPSIIQQYLTKRLRDDKISRKSANHILGIIKAFLSFCVKHQYVAHHAAASISPYKVPRIPGAHLSQKAIQALLTTAKEISERRFYPMIATAIYAGLRLGELLALEWTDIEFEQRRIMVQDKPQLGLRTKSGKFRTVPLNHQLHAILEPMKQSAGFCFFPVKRVRYSTSNFNRQFKRIIEKAGLPQETNWLTLRRTFGSQLAQAGVSIFKIQKWMGHSDPRITMEHYAHLSPEYDEDINRFPVGVAAGVSNVV